MRVVEHQTLEGCNPASPVREPTLTKSARGSPASRPAACLAEPRNVLTSSASNRRLHGEALVSPSRHCRRDEVMWRPGGHALAKDHKTWSKDALPRVPGDRMEPSEHAPVRPQVLVYGGLNSIAVAATFIPEL